MSMLGAADHETRSYLEVVDALRQHGAAPRADMEVLWRRIVFSVLISNTDDHLRNLTLNLSGYPGDGGRAGIDGTQWYHSRTVMEVLERQLTYDIDTFGGQSGAPVWELASNGSRYGVAIHTFGDTLNNGGTRITGGVFSNIADWVGEAP